MFALFLIWVAIAGGLTVALQHTEFGEDKSLKQILTAAIAWPLWLLLFIIIATLIGIVNLITPVLARCGVFDR